jgi:hypothetical protein
MNLWRIDMRYVSLNATKPITTDKDVKRTYVVRLLNSLLFYFYCASFFTLYYASFIFTLYYASFISTLHYISFICTFSCADPFFDICQDGASIPAPGGGVREGLSNMLHQGRTCNMKCIFVCPFILFSSPCMIN